MEGGERLLVTTINHLPEIPLVHLLLESHVKGIEIDLYTSTRGANGPLWDAWFTLKTSAQQRFALLERLDEFIDKHQVCSNTKVRSNPFLLIAEIISCQRHKIDEDGTFRRCGGYPEVYYCSKACQTQARDWSEGGRHRLICKEMQELRNGKVIH